MVKSTVEILQNFVAISEYMNFMCDNYLPALSFKVELSLKNKGDHQVFPTLKDRVHFSKFKLKSLEFLNF
jgi:P2-related tail formation protein